MREFDVNNIRHYGADLILRIKMIKFIKDLNRERKLLPKQLKLVDTLLAGGSGVVGFILLLYLYAHCRSFTSCKELLENDFDFWLSFFPAFMITPQIGQMVIFGTFTLTLRLFGKLSTKEAIRYSLLYRIPASWLENNA